MADNRMTAAEMAAIEERVQFIAGIPGYIPMPVEQHRASLLAEIRALQAERDALREKLDGKVSDWRSRPERGGDLTWGGAAFELSVLLEEER